MGKNRRIRLARSWAGLAAAALAIACDPEPAPAECPEGTQTELTGEVAQSTTLLALCSPYRVTGISGVTFLGADTVVTIEPGVEVLIDDGLTIILDQGARLQANGDAANPITLRASGAGFKSLELRTGPGGTTRHELRYVTVRGAGIDELDPERPAVRLDGGGPGAPAELLADHLTIDGSGGVGLSLRRDEYTRLAEGTTDLVVRGASSYPLSLSAQNLATLPARQDLSSANPDRNVIAVDGGDESVITGDHAWAVQDLPLRLTTVAKYSVGVPEAEGYLELEAGLIIELADGHFEFDNGSAYAAGTTIAPIELVGDGSTGLILDARNSGTAEESIFRNVVFRDVVVEIYSPTTGLPGKCIDDGPQFVDCQTEGSGCLEIRGYTDASFDVECKASDC